MINVSPIPPRATFGVSCGNPAHFDPKTLLSKYGEVRLDAKTKEISPSISANGVQVWGSSTWVQVRVLYVNVL